MTRTTEYEVRRLLAGCSGASTWVGNRRSLRGARALADRHVGYGTYCTIYDRRTCRVVETRSWR